MHRLVLLTTATWQADRGRHELCDNNVQGAVQAVILGHHAWGRAASYIFMELPAMLRLRSVRKDLKETGREAFGLYSSFFIVGYE